MFRGDGRLVAVTREGLCWCDRVLFRGDGCLAVTREGLCWCDRVMFRGDGHLVVSVVL